MSLIQLKEIILSYGENRLLNRVNLSILPGERIGLIGRNGTGKSSLLKIIAGIAQPDDGEIHRRQALKVAMVEQMPQYDPEASVFDIIEGAFQNEKQLLKEYDTLVSKLNSTSAPEMERLDHLQHELEHLKAWQIAEKVHQVAERFNLDETVKIGQLSGGWIKRIALARAFVQEPDLLLLDEPTNHLDIASIEWLEKQLVAAPFACFLITHDRHFLDQVVNRIVELDRGDLRSFPGNFSKFQRLKQEQNEREQVEQAKFDKLLAQEEIWIRKGVEARRTKSVARIERLQLMRQERAQRRQQMGTAKMQITTGQVSGKLVAELHQVSHVIDGFTLVQDLTLNLQRGDRLALIGPNGIGKTTLIRLILGQLRPSSGTIKIGTQLAVAYFDQMRTQLSPDLSIAEAISPGSEYLEINGNKTHVMSYLQNFLFAPSRSRAPIRTLSGGELARLHLARLFAKPSNLLVLDEPTNDLDMETLDLLEDLLQDYTGTVLLVSHDRQFIDSVATNVLVAQGDGIWIEDVGGYSHTIAQSTIARLSNFGKNGLTDLPNQSDKTRLTTVAGPTAKNAADDQSTHTRSTNVTEISNPLTKKRKLTYKESRELENLPTQLDAWEQEVNDLTKKLQDPTLFTKDPVAAKTISQRISELQQRIDDGIERWQTLELLKGE